MVRAYHIRAYHIRAHRGSAEGQPYIVPLARTRPDRGVQP